MPTGTAWLYTYCGQPRVRACDSTQARAHSRCLCGPPHTLDDAKRRQGWKDSQEDHDPKVYPGQSRGEEDGCQSYRQERQPQGPQRRQKRITQVRCGIPSICVWLPTSRHPPQTTLTTTPSLQTTVCVCVCASCRGKAKVDGAKGKGKEKKKPEEVKKQTPAEMDNALDGYFAKLPRTLDSQIDKYMSDRPKKEAAATAAVAAAASDAATAPAAAAAPAAVE
jgi:hypothetical protein